MTREEQIAIASCAYGSKGSSIDFERGAKWADANPKSSWISLKDKLPCDEEDMVIEFLVGVELRTKKVCAIGRWIYRHNLYVQISSTWMALEYL